MMQGTLGMRLRVLRAERGWTQREAASHCGVTKETLGWLERGERQPHDITLAKIARGYGIPVEELLGEEPAPLVEPPGHEDLPRHREDAAFIIAPRMIGGELRHVVLWNVPEEERDRYRPDVEALLGSDYPEEDMTPAMAEALATA